ncbi:hypothetical protein JTE90_003738 [Oedothorax gibbosus]|uniref:Uncharacterized protein n=1 Tax=Oedothorax gibbosus TaxID=931172 RepID=A0AAV6VA64_9ARAC|nr:hypothetical protein JTE90_003738 [Oedothorax gibbosus]
MALLIRAVFGFEQNVLASPNKRMIQKSTATHCQEIALDYIINPSKEQFEVTGSCTKTDGCNGGSHSTGEPNRAPVPLAIIGRHHARHNFHNQLLPGEDVVEPVADVLCLVLSGAEHVLRTEVRLVPVVVTTHRFPSS